MVEEIFVKSFKQGPIEFAVTKKCLLIDWLNFQWYNAVDIRKWYTIHYFTQEVHHSDLEISKLGKLSEIHQKKAIQRMFWPNDDDGQLVQALFTATNIREQGQNVQ